jgi:hypothetical protein
MRRVWMVVFVVVACKKGPDDKPAPAPKPAVAIDAAVAACNVDGSYRTRFKSNGSEGWWFPFTIAGGKAQLTQKVPMLDLEPGPLGLAVDGCKVKVTTKSDHAGDVTLAFTLDPNANTFAGQLNRMKPADEPPSQPVTGRRDVAPLATACLRPGVFHLVMTTKKWKLSEGEPRFGMTCKEMGDPVTQATVRIQPYGDELIVDEVSGEPDYGQSFERGEVKKLGDCDLELKLAIQDFDFTAKLTLAGDKITGTASDAHYQFFEDGDAGENLWGCKAKNIPITGTRVAD